jgi:hypothetical protein
MWKRGKLPVENPLSFYGISVNFRLIFKMLPKVEKKWVKTG